MGTYSLSSTTSCSTFSTLSSKACAVAQAPAKSGRFVGSKPGGLSSDSTSDRSASDGSEYEWSGDGFGEGEWRGDVD